MEYSRPRTHEILMHHKSKTYVKRKWKKVLLAAGCWVNTDLYIIYRGCGYTHSRPNKMIVSPECWSPLSSGKYIYRWRQWTENQMGVCVTKLSLAEIWWWGALWGWGTYNDGFIKVNRLKFVLIVFKIVGWPQYVGLPYNKYSHGFYCIYNDVFSNMPSEKAFCFFYI